MDTLTKYQHAALDAFGRKSPASKVVGWDHACGGPIVEIGPDLFLAITKRGRHVERPAYHRCHCGRVHAGECAGTGLPPIPKEAICR